MNNKMSISKTTNKTIRKAVVLPLA
jgi:hypothetical protein